MARAECCVEVEPCHSSDCSGLDLIQSLLPQGRLWDVNRASTSGAYFRALGEVFTLVNKELCQEFNELNPCEAERLLPMWSAIYCFPSECVELTADNMCEWLELAQDLTCPIGTIGFYKAIIAWVITKTIGCSDIELEVNQRGMAASKWEADHAIADRNTFVVIAPPSCYVYDELKDCYFIPAIECLRKVAFPVGVSLGYKTNPTGPADEDIFGVPPANTGIKPNLYYDCTKECS